MPKNEIALPYRIKSYVSTIDYSAVRRSLKQIFVTLAGDALYATQPGISNDSGYNMMFARQRLYCV